MSALPAGSHLAHQLVRNIPYQLSEEFAGTLASAATKSSQIFEVTSPVTDRNQYDPTTNPGSGPSAIGFWLDFYVFLDKTYTVNVLMGINGSATLRQVSTQAGVASTTTRPSPAPFRITASYVQVQIVNNGVALGTLEYGIYIRSV